MAPKRKPTPKPAKRSTTPAATPKSTRTARRAAAPERPAVKLDLRAPIVPGTSAGGVSIWQPIAEVLAVVEPKATQALSRGMKSYTFDGIKLWATGGLITQIGLVAGYRGVLEPAVRVGARPSALEEIGALGINRDGMTIVDGLHGVVFDVPGTKIKGVYVTALGEYDPAEEDD